MKRLGLSTKPELRYHFSELRNRLDETQKKDLDLRISDATVRFLNSKSNPHTQVIWTAYFPIRNEVDPKGIMTSTSHRIRWALPLVSDGEMTFRIPLKMENLRQGVYGIQEPDPAKSEPVPLEQIEGCLIPGLAFDRMGYRLGYGKGFYDQFLTGFDGCSVGLAYGFQIAEEPLPKDGWDVPVKFIITEHEVVARETA